MSTSAFKYASEAHAWLELVAETMAPGTRERIKCPKCNGGDTGEESLSLFRDHDKRIAWKCFRASCGYSGSPKGVSGGSTKTSTPKYFTQDMMAMFTDHPYGLESIYDNHALFLVERFGINVRSIRWSYEANRYVLPIKGPANNLRGHIAYSFSNTPKSLTYRELVDEPFIHYVWPDTTYGHSVVVEDWFSAQKVADSGALGIALLGTVLNRERIDEIKQATKGTQVILALDNDAFNKAVKYVLDFGGEFDPPMKVARLKKDLKYVQKDYIRKVLNEGRTNFAGGDS